MKMFNLKPITILGAEVKLDMLFKGSKLYYGWVAILLLLVSSGFFAYYLQLSEGFIVTGSRNVVSWSLYIINFIFFVGLAAGGLIVASSVELFGVKKLEPLLKVGVIQAFVCAVTAMAFVTADLGHPERFYRFFLSPNTTSMMFFDFMILGGYTALCCVDLYALLTRRMRWLFPLAVVSLPAAISVHSVTGWVFGLVKSRPSWFSAIMAPLFISSAITSGLALLIIITLVLPKYTNIKFRDPYAIVMTLRKALTIAIPVDLFFLFNEILITVWPYAQKPEHHLGIHFIQNGPYAFSLYGEILLSAVIPFIIVLHPRTKNSIKWIAAASVFVVGGIFLKRIFLILVGMSISPLGELVVYIPTILELNVVVGFWAMAVLMFTVMIRIFNMDPVEH